jgi:hypothetical protein
VVSRLVFSTSVMEEQEIQFDAPLAYSPLLDVLYYDGLVLGRCFYLLGCEL